MSLKVAVMLGMFLVASLLPSPGAAFPLYGQLTGDPRASNPDNLIVDVTIVAIDADTVQWTIDINSPLHPNARLDEFYFNVVTPIGGSYTFDGFNPANWAIASPASPAGGGSISFNFEALDPAGPPNAADVNNATNLVFNMNLLGGPVFTDALFLTAATSCSSDATLGCGQLGGHIQSLTIQAGSGVTSDSGFVLGRYLLLETPPPQVPEPGTLSLLGALFLAVGLVRRGRRAR